MSTRLAETEQAYLELVTMTEVATGTAEAGAVATGGNALLGGVAELLPFLIFVWPATAHAPGIREEKPQVRAARTKLEERVKALADAARQVENQRNASSRQRAPRPLPGSKPREDRDGCHCICGPPKGTASERLRIGLYLEWRCRSICAQDYGFKYNEYVCE